MADARVTSRVIIVGAGPAGVRAAERLVEAGLRPTVIDEGFSAGGQIYRRPPDGQAPDYKTKYGADADRARALHAAFASIEARIDYRPRTLAWNVRNKTLWIAREDEAEALPFDALLFATGAADRMIPIEGWTLPGCYSMGGAQIALKAHGCSVGSRVCFVGTGPLLYLVAWQYVRAGAQVAAVLDTAPGGAQIRALPDLLARPEFLLRGARYRAELALRGVPVRTGVRPVAVKGEGQVERFVWQDASGVLRETVVDAVGLGFHLRSEAQLADLAGVPFIFDPNARLWAPKADRYGRTSVSGVYMAGDGARVLGADAAEVSGRLAALAILADFGHPADAAEQAALEVRMAAFEKFRRGLGTAFPWPADLAASQPDTVSVCRCEQITAGQLRDIALAKGAPEMNRTKALSRVGMGRCQGRSCGAAAAEILAATYGVPLEAVGRLRGQAPVKPLSASVRLKGGAS